MAAHTGGICFPINIGLTLAHLVVIGPPFPVYVRSMLPISTFWQGTLELHKRVTAVGDDVVPLKFLKLNFESLTWDGSCKQGG